MKKVTPKVFWRCEIVEIFKTTCEDVKTEILQRNVKSRDSVFGKVQGQNRNAKTSLDRDR